METRMIRNLYRLIGSLLIISDHFSLHTLELPDPPDIRVWQEEIAARMANRRRIRDPKRSSAAHHSNDSEAKNGQFSGIGGRVRAAENIGTVEDFSGPAVAGDGELCRPRVAVGGDAVTREGILADPRYAGLHPQFLLLVVHADADARRHAGRSFQTSPGAGALHAVLGRLPGTRRNRDKLGGSAVDAGGARRSRGAGGGSRRSAERNMAYAVRARSRRLADGRRFAPWGRARLGADRVADPGRALVAYRIRDRRYCHDSVRHRRLDLHQESSARAQRRQ